MAIKTIGVLGAGQMGSGIAQIAASKGYKVVLRDIKQEFCDNALAKMRAGLEKRVAAMPPRKVRTLREPIPSTTAGLNPACEILRFAANLARHPARLAFRSRKAWPCMSAQAFPSQLFVKTGLRFSIIAAMPSF